MNSVVAGWLRPWEFASRACFGWGKVMVSGETARQNDLVRGVDLE